MKSLKINNNTHFGKEIKYSVDRYVIKDLKFPYCLTQNVYFIKLF